MLHHNALLSTNCYILVELLDTAEKDFTEHLYKILTYSLWSTIDLMLKGLQTIPPQGKFTLQPDWVPA